MCMTEWFFQNENGQVQNGIISCHTCFAHLTLVYIKTLQEGEPYSLALILVIMKGGAHLLRGMSL